MALFDDVKTVYIGISASNTLKDVEIVDLIAAAKKDLMRVGILSSKANDESEPLIRTAIITYCKAKFGKSNPDAGKLEQSYQSMAASLSMTQEYITEVVV